MFINKISFVMLVMIMLLSLFGCIEMGQYTISFETNGGSEIEKIVINDINLLKMPHDPTREGYIFNGWYWDNESFQEPFTINSILEKDSIKTITLYAQWIIDENYIPDGFIKVSFDARGGSFVASQNVLPGTTLLEPTSSREGYTLLGWYTSLNDGLTLDEKWSFAEFNALETQTLYAYWVINQYTISFNVNGGNDIDDYVSDYNGEILFLSEPIKHGYTFSGWYLDEDLTLLCSITHMPSFDLMLYAKWTINTYTLTFYSHDDTIAWEETHDFNDRLEEHSAPSRAGYEFIGWYVDTIFNERFIFDTMPAHHVSLYPKWQTTHYIITYELYDGINHTDNPSTYTIEDYIMFHEPTKENYTFGGFYHSQAFEGEPVNHITLSSSGQITLYAKWIAKQFTLSFHTFGGTHIDTITFSFNEDIVLPDNPILNGYTFMGWYENEALTAHLSFSTMPNRDVTLYARYELIYYAITYYLNGGSQNGNNRQYYTVENNFSLHAPSRYGYSFSGWFNNPLFEGDMINTIERSTFGNLALYAKWTINQYTVSFDSNQGSPVSNLLVNYNEVVPKPQDPTRNGYKFLGWYRNQNLTTPYTFSVMPADNLTLYAKWEIINYTLTYNLNGGMDIHPNPMTYTVLNSIVFSVPQKTYYTFDGWYDNENFEGLSIEGINKGSFGNVSLYAKWTMTNYVISFESNQGSIVSNIIQTFNGPITKPEDPTRDGYIFSGWYYEQWFNTLFQFSTMPAQNLTLYAKWDPISYTITYVLNGGVKDPNSPTTYTIMRSVELNEPTKIGYHFDGWFANETFGGTPVASISSGTMHNLTFYAKWSINEYSIDYQVVKSNPQMTSGINLQTGETIAQVALGHSHSAVLTSFGRLFMWGSNQSGQLGIVATNNQLIPLEITHRFTLSTGEKIAYIALGSWHTAVLTSSGRLFMFGLNNYGQLGDGTTTNRFIPTEITNRFSLSSSEKINEVVLSSHNSASISSSGKIFMWGHNQHGQIGDGTTTQRLIPTNITYRFPLLASDFIISVSMRASTVGALSSSGRMFMWGYNGNGQIGDNTTTQRHIPTEITSRFTLSPTDKINQISIGDGHSSALTYERKLFMWGSNGDLQLGDGSITSKSVPTDITSRFNLSPDDRIKEVSLGSFHSAAISEHGRIFLWGSNYSQQVYNSPFTFGVHQRERTHEFVLEDEDEIVHVVLGTSHSSLLTERSFYLWGLNSSGQLGNGLTTNTPIPYKLANYENYQSIHRETYIYQSQTHGYETEFDGYMFDGWYSDITLSKPYNFMSMPAYNITLYAKLLPIEYTINYELDGGIQNDNNPTDYTILSTFTLLNPTKEYYQFNGFYDNPAYDGEVVTSISEGSTGAITLYAKWTINQYTLYFSTLNGTPIPQITLPYNAIVIQPEDPIRIGSIFAGWYLDTAYKIPYTFSTMPGHNTLLHAKWNLITYTIAYELNGGINHSLNVQTYTVDDIVKLYNPSKVGYTFSGWYDNELCEGTPLTVVTSYSETHITLYAKWTINRYTIYFESNEGTMVEDITLDYNEPIIIPEDPTRIGYQFGGWYSEASLLTPYLFQTMPNKHITLYAKWEPISYSITYHLDGGTNHHDNRTHYFIYEHVELLEPTKPGYTFIGFFESSAYDGDMITQIPKGSIVDYTLYAKWSINQYTITYTNTMLNTFDPLSLIQLLSEERILKSSLGGNHSAALTSENRLFMWGYNQYGQLGNNTNAFQLAPIDITPYFNLFENEKIRHISLGGSTSAAVTSLNRVFIWGYNPGSRLNLPLSILIPTDVTSYFPLSTDDMIISVELGNSHFAVLTHYGRLYMWGMNTYGQLGNNSTQDMSVPVDIRNQFVLESGEKIKEISLGMDHTIAITTYHKVFTWGRNTMGQLGNNATTQQIKPINITSRFNFDLNESPIQVSLGSYHSSLLTNFGRLFMWGHNQDGQLGHNTRLQKNIPVDITSYFYLPSYEKITQISMGSSHASAKTSSNRLFMWGYPGSGQLGYFSQNMNQSVPYDITQNFILSFGDFIKSIELGSIHASILTQSGRMFTWGSNNSAQLGSGTYINHSMDPISLVKYDFETIHSVTQTFNTTITFYQPHQNGYVFKGWYTDPELKVLFNATHIPAMNVKLYAKWEIIPYAIYYISDIGGSNHSNNPKTYTIIDTIQLYGLTKEGYTFIGWYDNPEYEGETISHIQVGSTGDVYIYAKWLEN